MWPAHWRAKQNNLPRKYTRDTRKEASRVRVYAALTVPRMDRRPFTVAWILLTQAVGHVSRTSYGDAQSTHRSCWSSDRFLVPFSFSAKAPPAVRCLPSRETESTGRQPIPSAVGHHIMKKLKKRGSCVRSFIRILSFDTGRVVHHPHAHPIAKGGSPGELCTETFLAGICTTPRWRLVFTGKSVWKPTYALRN